MKGRVIMFLFLIINLSLFALAVSDVAYVLKKTKYADSGFLDVFEEMDLEVDLIESKEIKTTDFSNYKFIFVGDDRLKNVKYIPVNEYPSVIANHYYGKQFELIDKKGTSKLVATSSLNVLLGYEKIQVYEKAKYKFSDLGIPYYYLPEKYKNNCMESIATVPTHNKKQGGDVIAYSSEGAGKCFFGITKTKYWTVEARNLFIDCVEFVMQETDQGNETEIPNNETPEDPSNETIECHVSSDCGVSGLIGENYCFENNVVKDFITYTCNEPGTGESYCSSETRKEIIEECAGNCFEGECVESTGEESGWLCEDDETFRDDCISLSSGLGTRCYLNEEKTTWDSCSTGWIVV